MALALEIPERHGNIASIAGDPLNRAHECRDSHPHHHEPPKPQSATAGLRERYSYRIQG